MASIRRTHNVGDRPEPAVYTFQDSSGAAINLTGYTATTKWMGPDGVAKTGTATVSVPASGVVTWTWPPAIFDRSWSVGFNAVVTNGSLTFRSNDYQLTVQLGAGGA
jgi:hypothetical protein